ncbi:uncharacterized protein A4U43_C05F3460 [Asparagus officinalis]|uniref:30S ribosomal protein S9 n=1 Tax=Asparagus officinalis TaxID=4686 RepID=A0A5P1ERK1_ASPOF|nr:28S ribosomal protein S9, mitochondrial [Asparagus officinalis]ONK67757.1 uncharacterized protein A4U43_C05F3460 [Asparagus officinalis]
MLSRLFSRSLASRLKTLTLVPSSSPHSPIITSPRFYLLDPNPNPSLFLRSLRPFSSKGNGDGDGPWNFPPESESVFGEEIEAPVGAKGSEVKGGDPWMEEPKGDIFEGIDKETMPKDRGVGDWETAEGFEPWSVGGDADGKDDVFGIGDAETVGFEGLEMAEEGQGKSEEMMELERKEQDLLATLKGPSRAFGDLIAASGITEDMIDSLILLKDVRGIPGLPPLQEIEDKAIERLNATSTRAEIERKKQEEIAKARVRRVDEKGRAYGTGRRKCSIARVWINPGDGKFIVNDKQFDVYFPILDHRAELLRPFTVTNSLGLWDVKCTVKGGGVSGQVGAIRLGISRALQNWEPGLRPYLKSAGYLTRDARVVERKKYGKAKARKSFQWVKR